MAANDPCIWRLRKFEAASCPRVRNEIKKTKLYSNTAPAADICTLLGAGRVNRYFLVWTCLKSTVTKLLMRPVRERKNEIVDRDYPRAQMMN